jgi:4-carboxymuconolactone decarboxylase
MALTEHDVRLARLSVAMALGRFDELRRLRAAAPPGEPDRAWREAALQAHLFGGFPRAVESFAVLDQAGGLGVFEPAEELDEAAAAERGRELFERIYGAGTEALELALSARAGALSTWIAAHAYGRVLTRPGLGADRRELLAVACLAALGPERQLAGHVRGALRCGATADELTGVLERVADLIEPERFASALRLVERLSAE